MTSASSEPLPPPSPWEPGEPLPRLLPRWLWGLAGLGLFLAGAILGGVLMASLLLYRWPAESPCPTCTPPPPTAVPAVHTATPTETPQPTRPAVGPGIGQEAPAFALPALDGITYTLAAYRGKTVLLNFWASWCPPCRREWPELRAVAQDLEASGAVLLAVNVEETPAVVRAFVATETLPFAVLLDQDGQVSERYHVSALPTTFLIDPAGLVRQVIPGGMDRATLKRLLRP